MKKLTYDQIKNIYNEKLKEAKIHIHHDTPDGKAVYLMLETFVDSINECIEGPEKEISFAGKLVRFHQEQEYRSGIKVRYCFSTDGDYKCTVDDGDNVGVEFSETQKTYMFSKNDVYLSEEK